MLLRSIAGEDRGQALIELALVMPVLTALLIGAAEFGRIAYAAIEVTIAARAGVAYGAQTIITAADLAGMQSAATNDGSDITALKPNGLSAVAAQSCTCSDGTSVTCATAGTKCVSPAHILTFVTVTTTAKMDPLFHVPGLPTTYTLNGAAKMQVAQ